MSFPLRLPPETRAAVDALHDMVKGDPRLLARHFPDLKGRPLSRNRLISKLVELGAESIIPPA